MNFPLVSHGLEPCHLALRGASCDAAQRTLADVRRRLFTETRGLHLGRQGQVVVMSCGVFAHIGVKRRIAKRRPRGHIVACGRRAILEGTRVAGHETARARVGAAAATHGIDLATAVDKCSAFRGAVTERPYRLSCP
jgi:hypothetical protein